jgi:hypothetical protein
MRTVHPIMLTRPECICVAARLFETSMIPPTERSIPRVTTTMLCPTATSTVGTAVFTTDVHSKTPGTACSCR